MTSSLLFSNKIGYAFVDPYTDPLYIDAKGIKSPLLLAVIKVDFGFQFSSVVDAISDVNGLVRMNHC